MTDRHAASWNVNGSEDVADHMGFVDALAGSEQSDHLLVWARLRMLC